MYTDGRVSLRYEEALAKCRFYDTADDRGKPPYAAVCDVARWTSTICELRGFKGQVSRGHVRLLTTVLLDRGYRVAYLERPDGQGLDHVADRIDGGDFDGWYRLDLARLAKKLRIQDVSAAP